MPKVKLNIRNIEGKTIKTTDGKSIGLPPKIGNTELFDTVLPGPLEVLTQFIDRMHGVARDRLDFVRIRIEVFIVGVHVQ